MMLFCQRRERTPVTIVMRGIYISYLAVNHSDLLLSWLFHARKTGVCLGCICMHKVSGGKQRGVWETQLCKNIRGVQDIKDAALNGVSLCVRE